MTITFHDNGFAFVQYVVTDFHALAFAMKVADRFGVTEFTFEITQC